MTSAITSPRPHFQTPSREGLGLLYGSFAGTQSVPNILRQFPQIHVLLTCREYSLRPTGPQGLNSSRVALPPSVSSTAGTGEYSRYNSSRDKTPVHVGTCDAKQDTCSHNTTWGQAWDGHSCSKRERQEGSTTQNTAQVDTLALDAGETSWGLGSC